MDIVKGRNWKELCLIIMPGWRVGRAQDSWSKGCEFESRQEWRVNFFSPLLFGVRSTLVLPQWHVKDAGHSAKIAGGRLHLNTNTPLTQQSRSGLTMLLSRHCMGIYQETSSYATHQETLSHSFLSSLSHCGLTDPGLKSEMSMCKLIL